VQIFGAIFVTDIVCKSFESGKMCLALRCPINSMQAT